MPGDANVAAGGASTVNQYLAAAGARRGSSHITPFTVGAGTRIFDGVPPLKFEQVSSRAASLVTHVTYRAFR